MAKPVNLSYAIGLSPQRAIEYFKSKGYAINWNWHETWQSAHAKAFTVAKVTRMDVLEDIRGMVDKAISEGITYRQFQKELEPRLRAKGWWGKVFVVGEDGKTERVQLGSPWRLKNIYRTNMQTALMAGRYNSLLENAEDRPFWQYVAVLDARTRPQHGALNGKVYRYDDPFWETFYPPNGFGCRCRVRALREKQIERKGIEVETAQGKIFEMDKPLSKRTGEMRPVGAMRVTDTSGRTVTVSPDVGWSYNPGVTNFKPDLKRYPPKMRKKYNEATTTFQEARTLKQAEEWALAQGLATRVSYKGLALEAANEMNKAVFEVFRFFPELKGRLKFIGSAQERNKAYLDHMIEKEVESLKEQYETVPESIIKILRTQLRRRMGKIPGNALALSYSASEFAGIAYNNKFFSTKALKATKAAMFNMSENIKFHPKGTATVRAIVDHELGHQIELILSRDQFRRLRVLFNNLSYDEIKEGLSEYATFNVHEFIAEAWSEFRNAAKPRKLAKQIGKIIMEGAKK